MRERPPAKYDVEEDFRRPYEHRIGPKIDVLMDEKPVTRVIRYDSGAGTIDRLVTDESGSVVLNEARDEALTERITGKVTVRWRTESPCLG